MKRNDKILIICAIIILTTSILLSIYASRTERLLLKYAKNQTYNTISKIIDETIRDILSKEEYKIIEIEKDNTNQITNINFNNNKINLILTQSTKKLFEEINKKSNQSKIYTIPFGIIYNNHLLSNLGPEIPYVIDLLSDIDTNTYINIKEYGINNSMIEVLLNIKISIQVLLPFVKETIVVEDNIILESKIIQGSIPEYYGNVNSLLK